MTEHDDLKVKWKWQKPPGAPKRPLSAYNYFFSDMRSKLISKTGDKTTAGSSSLVQQISGLWKEIPDQERVKYHNMARESKEKYLLLKKNWFQTEGYKEVLIEKHAKKKVIQAKYRARRKSKEKLMLEESKFKQAYSVSSSKDVMDDRNNNSSSQADCHATRLHDISEESDRIAMSVGTIEDDDISHFSESYHRAIPHHKFDVNDILVTVGIIQDEKSVSDLSGNVTVPSIVEQREYTSRFDQHYGDQIFQGLDHKLKCTTSYLLNQESTRPNNEHNRRRGRTSSKLTLQPGISEIQRMYAERLQTGALNFPVVKPKKFDIDQITADSLGLNSTNQCDRVFNTTNCLFRHGIYDDAYRPIKRYNTVVASRNKHNCRFISNDYPASAYARTSTCVHDPYNYTSQSSD